MTESLGESPRFDLKVLRKIISRLAEPNSILTLHVSDGISERLVYFSAGGVRLLSVGERRGPDLQSHLLARGLLDVTTLHSALEEVRDKRRSLREVLVEKKVLEKDDYDRIVKRLLRNEILDLALWEDAYYACYLRAPPQEMYKQEYQALVGTLDFNELSAEVNEWIQQWARQKSVLLSERAMLSLTPEGERAVVVASEPDRDALLLASDCADVRTVWMRSGFDLPVVCNKLTALAEKKWVTVIPPIVSDDDTEALIRQLEASLPKLLGKDLVRERLVTLYRRAGQPERAAAELFSLGDSAMGRGEWPLATERWKRVLELDPTHLDALRKVVTVYAHQNLTGEARALATAHARVLLDRRRHEEAKEVAKLVSSLTGAELEAAGLEAAILASAGEVRDAVEQFVALSETYLKREEWRRAIEVLRKAFEIDPQNRSVAEKLNKLERERGAGSADTKTTNRRRKQGGKARRPPRESRSPPALLLGLLALAVLVAVLHWSGFLSRVSAGRDSEADRPHPASGTDARATLQGLAPPSQGSGGPGRPAASQTPLRGDASLPPAGGRTRAVEPARPQTPEPLEDSGGRPTTRPEGRPAPNARVVTQKGGGLSMLEGRSGRRGDAPSPAEEPWPEPSLPAEVRAKTIGRSIHVPDVCPHEAAHTPVEQPLDAMRVAVHAPSCDLVFLERSSGTPLFHRPGAPGYRWALGFRGRIVCHWRAGERPQLIRPPELQVYEVPLALPDRTDALAVGEDSLVFRFGTRTQVVNHRGGLVAGGRLPPWEEGFLVGDALLLLRRRPPSAPGDGVASEAQDARGTPAWVFDPTTLELLWPPAGP